MHEAVSFDRSFGEVCEGDIAHSLVLGLADGEGAFDPVYDVALLSVSPYAGGLQVLQGV